MDNFEARYRAIVEKVPEVRHPELEPDDFATWFYKTGSYFVLPTSCARAAVCWWLAGKLPDDWMLRMYGGVSQILVWDDAVDEWVAVRGFDNPADAILTAWEIVLGIKEKP